MNNSVKFDYEAVANAVSTMNSALDTIKAAIEKKVPNTTYVSGNAKGEVDAYINALNNAFNPIQVEVNELATKLNEIYTTYLAADTGIKTAMSDGAGAGDASGMNASNSHNINMTHM